MVTTKCISINDYDFSDVKNMCEDIAGELKKIGVKMELSESTSTLYISYEPINVHYKLKRNAGLRCMKATTASISASECRSRMKDGEKAEKIAKEYGISRATFFRKLKIAEESGMDKIPL